jgi:hypothetical protein
MHKLLLVYALAWCGMPQSAGPAAPIQVEGESFNVQERNEIRKWHIIRAPDGHSAGAGGQAYVQVLPDTRRTHGDKLVAGENFSDEPGRLAVLHYRVNIEAPGRYYVWVRAYSTGTEDNGIHVGIDGTWPDSGRRMQWCQGKNSWRWESSQRTAANHCGEPGKIYLDVQTRGEHTISFSMRGMGSQWTNGCLLASRPFGRRSETARKYSRIGVSGRSAVW